MSGRLQKMCLGTAQFGLDYGIANTTGRISDGYTAAILSYAAKQGITMLDTASAYGVSEEAIGRVLKAVKNPLDIVSKLPSFGDGKIDVRGAVIRSLNRLGLKNIYGYLVHSFEDYRKHTGLWTELSALKSEGLIRKIGFSLYHPHEADVLIDGDMAVDIVQVPYSVFDRRFADRLGKLKSRGIEVHVRSVFLQGLAFLDPAQLPKSVAGARAQVEELRRIAKAMTIPVSVLCLDFALLNPDVDRVVVGIDSLEHLQKNISDLRSVSLNKSVDLNSLMIEDENILLPYLWKS